MDRQKKTLIVLAVSNMFTQCCQSLMSPFYPLEALKKGVNQTVIGIIFSCAEFIIFLTSPFFGMLLPTAGPRFVYVAGLCTFGVCDVLFGFLNQCPPGAPFVALSFAVRIVEATGAAALMTASFAIAGIVYPEKVATAYSILMTAAGVGYAVGPAVGGLLYDAYGFGFPFWVLGSCVFLCGCFTLILLRDLKGSATLSSETARFWTLLRNPSIVYGVVSFVFSNIAISAYGPTLAQDLTQFAISSTASGFVFMAPAVTYSLASPVCGRLLDKNVDALSMSVFGLFGAIVSLMMFGPAPFLTFIPQLLWLKILSAALLGIFVAATSTGAVGYVFQGARTFNLDSDEVMFSLVAGITQSSMTFGSFLGPLIGGAVTDQLGFAWSQTVIGFSCILQAIVGVLILCKRKGCLGLLKRTCQNGKYDMAYCNRIPDEYLVVEGTDYPDGN